MDEIDIYLKEDLGFKGDITSDALFTNEEAEGYIIAKEKCVVAGIKEIQKVLEKLDVKTNFFVKDGYFVKQKTKIAEVSGKAKSILKAERLVLNILSRMSGIATETKKLLDKCRKINPDIQIAATRKTTPGFRKFEKRAIMIGGGYPHRYGLYDAVMIKDNHIKIAGSLEEAVKKVKEKTSGETIEVEVKDRKDAIAAAKLSVDVIMLDNFKASDAKKISEEIKKINKKILVEVSGGINLNNAIDYVAFSDRISMGYLTHSVKSIDFSLEIW
jgi:nicotinate-nucleotide pyrophosphorylase (carboxylating)